MHLVVPVAAQKWAMSFSQQTKRTWKRMWAWWLATYVKFPLIRPVQYGYYVPYSFGPDAENRHGDSGSGSAIIYLASPFTMRSMDDLKVFQDILIEAGPWRGITPQVIVIMNWKLVHKQVFRQNAWHNARRHSE